MAANDDHSQRLLDRWQTGDQAAAAALFHRYADRLVALVRARLSAKLSRHMDPEDVVQSAYRSFFAGAQEGHFVLQRSGDLWHLLMTIALHKLNDQVKYHTASKRNIAVQQSFGSEDSLFSMQAAVFARDPGPIEAVAVVDELEQLMRRLDPVDRRIVEMRLRGHSLYEIADEMNRSVPTIFRVLERVKQSLPQGHASNGAS
jgi:RNA polymerase sigma-70 factor (ECF subfamily)